MVGKQIKELRGEEPRDSFAERFGKSRNTIMYYESGKRKPDSDFLSLLCKEYKVSPAWLLLGEGPKYLDQAGQNELIAESKPCSNPRCASHLHAHGHILAKAPPFDTELLAFIFGELYAYKDTHPVTLEKEQEIDVISLASILMQPGSRIEAELICSIVGKWIAKNSEGGASGRIGAAGQLNNFGTVMKVDLISDEDFGTIWIDYGSSEILRLLQIAIDQIPDKSPAITKAKSVISSSFIGNTKVGVVGKPVLNKKNLIADRKYLITADQA